VFFLLTKAVIFLKESHMKRKFFLRFRWVAIMTVFFILLLGAFTGAQAKVSFKGKAIQFVVPFSPGGGTDMFARLVARHIGQFLPGRPAIVVRNMPGGGSVIGANYAWMAKPNGRTLLATSGSTVMNGILRVQGAEYHLQKMYPLYAAPSGLTYCAKTGHINKPEDIMTDDNIIFGHVNATGGTGSGFVWARELLGFKTKKLVWGYGGGSAARRAWFQGELTIGGESTMGYNGGVKAYVERGEVVPILQSGILDDDGNVVREPAAPDVPTPVELYEKFHGKKPSGLVYEAYKLIVGSRTYGKTILLPQDTPADIVKAFEEATAKMVKDAKFLEDAEMMNPGAPHFFGKNFVKAYPAGVSGAPEVIKYMKKILTEKYGITFN
jgi:hypothetical protein